MINLAVFASGKGTNLAALHKAASEGRLPAHRIRLVVSDRPGCGAVEYARVRELPCLCFRVSDYQNQAAFETAILSELADADIQMVVLAGYMRLVERTLLNVWEGRMINLHPSLLPRFPGKDAIGQALRAGITETGVTVHYVDAGMDTGAVIVQERVAVLPDDNQATLGARIHAVEHRLLPEAIRSIERNKPPTRKDLPEGHFCRNHSDDAKLESKSAP